MDKTLFLLWPWMRGIRNSFTRGRPSDRLKGLFFAMLGLAFWVALFIGSLLFFNRLAAEEPFGPILVEKLIGFVFLIFFAVLVFSNVVTALNAFFLADDLYLIFSAPVSYERLYVSRYIQTMFLSSWMVLMFALPVFVANGVVFSAPWYYYPWMLAVLTVFLLLPCAMSTMITMILVKAFPAKKAQDVLIILAILFIVILYFLFRFMRPEQLFNPDLFQGFSEFFATMRAPDSPFLPTSWATVALNAGMSVERMAGDGGFYLMLLLANGMFGILVGAWFAKALYFTAYSKSQEGRTARFSSAPAVTRLIGKLIRARDPHRRQIMLKDIRTFFRETTQWSQLLLLLALIIVYLFNYKVLRLERYAGITFYLRNLVSYLNMILAGFVMSAVCVRFVLPAVSVEGKAFWIIRTAPVKMSQFLWSKFVFSIGPVFVVSEILIIVSNIFLKTSGFLMVVSAIIMGLLSFGIVALAVGIGAMYPNFEEKSVARMASSASSIIFMVVAIAYILLVIGVLAFPVRIWQVHLISHTTPSGMDWAITALSAALIAIVIAASVYFPMKRGIQSLESRED
jgi:ABC-2 type transport system permease protein